MMKKKQGSGLSVLELMIAMTILSIVGLVFARVSQMIFKTMVTTETMSKVTLASQQIFTYLEKDLYNANEIVVANSHDITIICDYMKKPKYVVTPANRTDPDIDHDIGGLAMSGPATRWTKGYNLSDDDDNNQGEIDYQIRYYLNGSILYRDYCLDCGTFGPEYATPSSEWGHHQKKIAVGVKDFSLKYFGSKENVLGSMLDVGHDGAADTDDDGEDDGIVDEIEIGETPPPGGQGNGMNGLETRGERSYITSVRIHVELDSNNDGKNDFSLNTEVYPPLLPLKPLQN